MHAFRPHLASTSLLVLLSACSGESKVGVVKQPPTVIVTAPSEGSRFSAGESVILEAQVQATSGEVTDILHEWRSGNDLLCESATVASDGIAGCNAIFLDPGEITVEVIVTDPQGDKAEASVGLLIEENTAPTMDILSPTDGASFTGSFVFDALVDDAEDSPDKLTVELSSDVSGDIPVSETPDSSGSFTQTVSLPGGSHLLSAKVIDSLGKFSRETLSIEINTPPPAPVVSLSPDPAKAGEELTVSVDQPSVDPDGDTVTYSYAFTINGVDYPNPTFPSTNPVLGPGVIEKGDYIEVNVYPNDGLADGSPGFDALTVKNTPPSLQSCGISPQYPNNNDDLIAVPSGFADPDGDAASYNYRWLKWDVNAWVDTGVIGEFYNYGLTKRGDIIKVECTPTDGSEAGTPVESASVTVTNAPPEMDSCELFPPDPTTVDDLTASPINLSDPDGDVIDVTYQWYVNGILDPSVTDAVYPSANYERDDEVTVECVPTDGSDAGTEKVDTVVVVNSPPFPPVLEMVPADPVTGNSIAVNIATDAVDPDGDPVSYSYYWRKDGNDYPNPSYPSSNNALAQNIVFRGEFWEIQVTASDSQAEGNAAVVSATIANRPPQITGCRISPTAPGVDDDLTAVPSGWNDAESDSEGYTYEWFIDYGNTGTSVSTGITADVLPAGLTSINDSVYVVCTPDDGFDLGPPLQSSGVLLGNSPPTATGCQLTPSSPDTTQDLIAQGSGFSDPDNDSPGWVYRWYVDGSIDLSENEATYPAAKTERDQEIVVECVPFDGVYEGTGVQDGPLTIENSAPEAPTVGIQPAEPETGEGLSVTFFEESDDADEDNITYTYYWFRDGSPVYNPTHPSTNSTINSSIISRGEVWTVEVEPSDGNLTGPRGTAQVTVRNAPPTLTDCTISPANPDSTDDLLAEGSGFSDAEGDPESYKFTWYKWSGSDWANTGVSSQKMPKSLTSRGDTFRVSCTPFDGTTSGSPIDSLQTVVGNAAPTIGACSISPSDPGTLEDVIATPLSWNDPDNDSPGYQYAWYKNSSLDPTVQTNTYPLSRTERDDEIYVVCTPDDSQDLGNPLTSATITVVNTPPTAAQIEIVPGSPTSGAQVEAQINVAATDPDNDQVTYNYYWTRDGQPYPNPSYPSTNPFIPAGVTLRDQFWQVTVRATDQTDEGPAAIDQILVANSPPTVANVGINPPNPDTEDDIVIVGVGWYDYDGDPEAYDYYWYKNDVIDSTVNGDTYPKGKTTRGDEIYGQLVPRDSYSTGTPVNSGTVTIENALPTAPVVSVTPFPPPPDQDLNCNIDDPSDDADGEGVAYTFEWFNTLGAGPITGATLPYSNTALGQGWWCEVTPTDDFGDDGSPGVSNTVFIQDLAAPDPPVIDNVYEFRNEEVVNLSGTCEADCSIDVYCTDDDETWQEVTTCSGGGTFSYSINLDRGQTTECYATCTDQSSNVSGTSNSVLTEVCSTEDPQELGGGYGDSGNNPADEWSSIDDSGTDSETIVGTLLEGDAGDWMVIYTQDNVAADNVAGRDDYDFNVELTQGAGIYTFLVYRYGYDPGFMECPAQFAVGYTEYSDYYIDRGDAPDHSSQGQLCRANSDWRNECTDFSGAYYIEIIRDPGVPWSCQPYELAISNNAP